MIRNIPNFAYYLIIEDVGRKRQDVKNGYKQDYVNKYM